MNGDIAPTNELVRYDAMCRAIDDAYEVDEVKDIRDKAIALETYFRVAQNPEPERRACDIRIRAERKAGKLLREMVKAKGGRPSENRSDGTTGFDPAPSGQGSQRSTSETPTLKDLGISKDQASRWQKLADVSEEEFEAALGAPEKPSTNGIIKPKPERGPMDPRALWLWGCLCQFKRDGVFNAAPEYLRAQMTDPMRKDVDDLAPLVTQLLKEISE